MEKIGNYKIAECDWKAPCEDVLAALQYEFKDEVPFLFSDEMTSLSENYNMEQTMDAVKALGQELSANGFLVFEIYEESDSFNLTIIPAADEEKFTQEMASLKRKVKCMLQRGKKAGAKARRIDFGKQLSGKVIKWDSQNWIMKADCPGNIYYSEIRDSDYNPIETQIFYFDPEPVILAKTSWFIYRLVGEEGRYLALMHNLERDENYNGIKDRRSYIFAGERLENINEWKNIATLDEELDLKDLIWYGDDLFLASGSKVYRIKNAMDGNAEIETVYETKERDCIFSCFAIVQENLYVMCQGQILKWGKTLFTKKDGFNYCFYKMEPSVLGPGTLYVINETEVAFVRQEQFSNDGKIHLESLVIVDVEKKISNVRKVEFCTGWTYVFEKNKFIVACHGHDVADNKKDIPVLAIIDLQSGEKKELPYGCFGPAEIRQVYATKDNRLLFKVNDKIILPDNMEEFFTIAH